MQSTHQIPQVSLPGVREEEFRCYPLRGDSLSLYSKLYDKRLRLGRGRLYVPPDQAAAIMAERRGVEPGERQQQALDALIHSDFHPRPLDRLPTQRADSAGGDALTRL